MGIPKLTVDREFGVEDAEGMVIMAGDLDGDRTRVQVSSDVWRLVLEHFNVGLEGGPESPEDKCFVAVEMIGAFVMERRGVPQYGVLNISLD